MKTKSKLRLSHFGLLVLVLSTYGAVKGQSQYGNYADYSSLAQSQSNSYAPEITKNVGLISERASQTELENGDTAQGQRSHQSQGGDPQGKSGSQSVFYYEMFPSSSPIPEKRCSYTESGERKCEIKRDSTSGVAVPSTFGSNNGDQVDSYLPSSSYNAPSSSSHGDSYSASSTHYGAPSQGYGYGAGASAHGYGGNGWGNEGFDNSGAAAGGIGGLAGLLGLFGLKGLKALFPYAFLVPLLPFIIPAVIIILLLPTLPLLAFLPIPLIVDNGRGRSGKGSPDVQFKTINLKSVVRLASDVLESEECVQKLSCQIAGLSRKFKAEKWTDKLAESLPHGNRYAKKILEGYKPNSTVNETGKVFSKELHEEECSIFTCQPRAIASKYLSKLN